MYNRGDSSLPHIRNWFCDSRLGRVHRALLLAPLLSGWFSRGSSFHVPFTTAPDPGGNPSGDFVADYNVGFKFQLIPEPSLRQVSARRAVFARADLNLTSGRRFLERLTRPIRSRVRQHCEGALKLSQDRHEFPTILATGYGNDSWNTLIRNLELEGYLVLTARDGAEVIEIAKTHSRPIHLLLVAKPSPALFAEAEPYQPGIQILIVDTSPERALARVREMLRPPEQRARRAGNNI
jgi:hypothetical protein